MFAKMVLLALTLTASAAFSTEFLEDGPRPPKGGYKDSCRRCSYDGRFLSCECRTSEGDWYPTELDVSRCYNISEGYVSNHESRLVCAYR